jgi:hypothetical protein
MYSFLRKNLGILFILQTNFCAATEIDSFTLRDPNLKDSTAEINNIMNNYIQESIRYAQGWHTCDEEKFIDDLHQRMGGFFWSNFENTVSSSSQLSSHSIALSQSIFQDFSFFLAPALYLARLGTILRVGKYFIGSDKFSHFISEGYSYYKILKDKDKSLKDALTFGENTEKTYFGMNLTGIYSHADLVANYEGFRGFWQKLISTGETRENTYVGCKNNTYYQIKLFDWSEHINAGWDEGINCNIYRTASLEDQALKRIKILEQARGVPLTCPIEPADCNKLVGLYQDIAYRLLSPKCF